MPDVENLLIAHGLDPATANRVVMGLVEGHVWNQLGAAESEEWKPVQLILAGILAALCLLVVYWKAGVGPTAWTLVCILPGLAGIWLPEMMAWRLGSATRVAGWLWLLLFGEARVGLVWIANPN